MGIKVIQANIFDVPSDAVVNPVNCVGVMGAGLAKQFKHRHNENYRHYAAACRERRVHIGQMFVTRVDDGSPYKFIINFPTKFHWENGSKLEYIQEGMSSLIETIDLLEIQSISIPPLGCGKGGLMWSIVKPVIVSYLEDKANLDVKLFEPYDPNAAN